MRGRSLRHQAVAYNGEARGGHGKQGAIPVPNLTSLQQWVVGGMIGTRAFD
ncbi:MAG: hypothetical protein ABJD53_13435 [Gammaproteobacteria bacterium]